MEFNLADLFEIVAATVPDRLALVAGAERRTYRELDERANRVAHHLADAGVEAGEHVAVYTWNRAEWLEAELGIYKARGAVINVNYRYVADELAYLLENSDSVAVIFERGFAPRLLAARSGAPALRHLVVVEDGSDDAESAAAVAQLGAVPYEEALAAASDAGDFAARSADDPYILYTGGTTGVPKGVVWRSEDIFFAALGGGGFGQPPIQTPAELAGRVSAEGARTVGIVNAPMMHGGGQWVTFIGFFGGNTVVLNCDHHYDGAAVLRLAERERANSIMVVGDAMARPLADALAAPGASYDLAALGGIGSGGAILSKAVKEELRSRVPGVIVTDSFGASETGAAGTVLDFHGPAAGPRFTIGDFVTVLDEHGHRVEPGSGRVGRLARPRPHPARLLQGRGEDRGDVRHRRRRCPLGRPGRQRADRGRRDPEPARARLGLHQHRGREGVPRGGGGRAEGPSRGVRRGRGRRPRRPARGAGRRDRDPPRRVAAVPGGPPGVLSHEAGRLQGAPPGPAHRRDPADRGRQA